jgi:hypothetical protein
VGEFGFKTYLQIGGFGWAGPFIGHPADQNLTQVA